MPHEDQSVETYGHQPWQQDSAGPPLSSSMHATVPSRAYQVILPAPPRAPIRAKVARAFIRRAERKLPFKVVVTEANDDSVPAQAIPGTQIMRLLRPESFYCRVGTGGLVGLGEAFQAGDWDSDGLAELLAVFAAGVDQLVPPPLRRIRRHHAASRRPSEEAQTIEGALRNARYHYALPNELFEAFLDETMCYSSGIFETDDDGRVIADDAALAEAQRRKIDRLLDLAGVGEGTRVLEIGTGWGELAVRAARRGALVHTVTNMAEHAERARDRVTQAGVAKRVHVEMRDYREVTADFSSDSRGYDAIVSIEMIEVVGPDYWPTYFRILERLLAPKGRIGLQAMTMRHDRMLRTSATYTWIDKYIFPGGTIPSITAIEQTLARYTQLRILQRYSFGNHYCATLRLWRERFNQNWASLGHLGFDDVFWRTWNFYLAYCEAGFASGYLDVHQFLLGR